LQAIAGHDVFPVGDEIIESAGLNEGAPLFESGEIIE
jgi:hypothetical protein